MSAPWARSSGGWGKVTVVCPSGHEREVASRDEAGGDCPACAAPRAATPAPAVETMEQHAERIIR